MIRVRTVLAAHADTEVCRTAQEAIEFVGRRWVGVVLIAGYLGARRFTEYRRLAAGISDRVLSQRLRELEQRGLLERTVTPSTPVQITYTPTARGAALVRALEPLASWWLEGSEDTRVAASSSDPGRRVGMPRPADDPGGQSLNAT